MSGLRRVYHNVSLSVHDEVLLPSDVRHHLLRVCRCQLGDRLALFNGDNHVYRSSIVELSSKVLRVVVEDKCFEDKESAMDVTLAQLVTRPRSMDWIVEKATELGAKRLLPIRGLHTPASYVADLRLAHWREKIISASAQSGRNCLMQLLQPLTFEKALRQLPVQDVMVLHPSASASFAEGLSLRQGQSISLLLGPEAGFSDKELAMIQDAGLSLYHMGKRTLRAETASLAALASLIFDR